jgi:hypothetical protein
VSGGRSASYGPDRGVSFPGLGDVVLVVAAALKAVPVAWPRWSAAAVAPAYAIGSFAAFWFLERIWSL